MDDLRSRLLQAAAEGSLGTFLARAQEDDDLLVRSLVELHNNQQLDVLAAFKDQTYKHPTDFFQCATLFAAALPSLVAPLDDVIRCVAHVANSRGSDGAPRRELVALEELLAKDEPRLAQAIKIIEDDPTLAVALGPALLAGSKLSPAEYAQIAIRLISSEAPATRRAAIAAAASLAWVPGSTPDIGNALLNVVTNDSDDSAVASALETALRLTQSGALSATPCSTIVDIALNRNSDVLTHTSAALIAFDIGHATTHILLALVRRVRSAMPVKHPATIDMVDHAIVRLFESKNEPLALELLESFLTHTRSPTELQLLDYVTFHVKSTPSLRNYVATRWLLNGNPALCRYLYPLVSHDGEPDSHLAADGALIAGIREPNIVLASRKAIGFLFARPIATCSFLMSLMQLTPHEGAKKEIADRLFDPMMLNYTHDAVNFVRSRAASLTGSSRKYVAKALRDVRRYVATIRATGSIPSLHPDETQRHHHNRHMADLIGKSLRDAQNKSPLMSIMTKQAILYSRKVVFHQYSSDGPQRVESAMDQHSASFEEARMTLYDPIGLEFMLRSFRASKLRS